MRYFFSPPYCKINKLETPTKHPIHKANLSKTDACADVFPRCSAARFAEHSKGFCEKRVVPSYKVL